MEDHIKRSLFIVRDCHSVLYSLSLMKGMNMQLSFVSAELICSFFMSWMAQNFRSSKNKQHFVKEPLSLQMNENSRGMDPMLAVAYEHMQYLPHWALSSKPEKQTDVLHLNTSATVKHLKQDKTVNTKLIIFHVQERNYIFLYSHGHACVRGNEI